MKFIEKLKKSEQGSVTIYVLSVTICVILILLSIFVGVMNKSSSQYKQIEQICSEYSGKANNEKIDNVYKETINRLNLTKRKLLSEITGNEKDNTLKSELKKLNSENLKIGIVIGPEGGFEESDVNILRENGARIVTLGNRILRTETVALNVLSIIMYELENQEEDK